MAAQFSKNSKACNLRSAICKWRVNGAVRKHLSPCSWKMAAISLWLMTLVSPVFVSLVLGFGSRIWKWPCGNFACDSCSSLPKSSLLLLNLLCLSMRLTSSRFRVDRLSSLRDFSSTFNSCICSSSFSIAFCSTVISLFFSSIYFFEGFDARSSVRRLTHDFVHSVLMHFSSQSDIYS